MFGRDNPEAASMAVRVMFWFLLSLPLYTVNLVFLNYYQSAGNLPYGQLHVRGDNFFFMMLFIGILSPVFGTDGVWISFCWEKEPC